MDIDHPERKKEGPKKPWTLTDAEAILIGAAGEVIGAQGSSDMLGFLQENHHAREAARYEKGLAAETSSRSDIENFLLSDHPSHLSKIAGLERLLAQSQHAISAIDYSDLSGKTLWDFIPEKTQNEVETQLKGLKSQSSLRTALGAEISGLCESLWQEHRGIAEKSREGKQEQLETLLLGPEKTAKDIESIRGAEAEIQDTQELAEMITLEKCRVATVALTAPNKARPEKELEAERLLGSDFELIKAQVAHMEGILYKEWLTRNKSLGMIESETTTEELLCPEIKARMVKGEPSQEQLDALKQAYETLTLRRSNEKPTDRDLQNEKITFVLGTMKLLEESRKALFTNLLRDIREKAPEKNEEMEKPKNWYDRIRDRFRERTGWGVGKPLKGLGRAVRHAPKLLAAPIVVNSVGRHLMQEFKDHYGNQAEFVKTVQEFTGGINQT